MAFMTMARASPVAAAWSIIWVNIKSNASLASIANRIMPFLLQPSSEAFLSEASTCAATSLP